MVLTRGMAPSSRDAGTPHARIHGAPGEKRRHRDGLQTLSLQHQPLCAIGVARVQVRGQGLLPLDVEMDQKAKVARVVSPSCFIAAARSQRRAMRKAGLLEETQKAY